MAVEGFPTAVRASRERLLEHEATTLGPTLDAVGLAKAAAALGAHAVVGGTSERVLQEALGLADAALSQSVARAEVQRNRAHVVPLVLHRDANEPQQRLLRLVVAASHVELLGLQSPARGPASVGARQVEDSERTLPVLEQSPGPPRVSLGEGGTRSLEQHLQGLVGLPSQEQVATEALGALPCCLEDGGTGPVVPMQPAPVPGVSNEGLSEHGVGEDVAVFRGSKESLVEQSTDEQWAGPNATEPADLVPEVPLEPHAENRRDLDRLGLLSTEEAEDAVDLVTPDLVEVRGQLDFGALAEPEAPFADLEQAPIPRELALVAVERSPSDELHHEVGRTWRQRRRPGGLDEPVVEHRHDAGVVQPRRSADLVLEELDRPVLAHAGGE